MIMKDKTKGGYIMKIYMNGEETNLLKLVTSKDNEVARIGRIVWATIRIMKNDNLSDIELSIEGYNITIKGVI